MAYFYVACAVHVTIFSTGGKFCLVSNFTKLHTLTQVACSYVLLFYVWLCMVKFVCVIKQDKNNTTNKSIHQHYRNTIYLMCSQKKIIIKKFAVPVTFQGSDTPSLAFQRSEENKEHHEVSLHALARERGEVHENFNVITPRFAILVVDNGATV